jgi:putative resolvase
MNNIIKVAKRVEWRKYMANITMEIEKHYKLVEAGKLLSVSTRTLRRWIKAGKIQAVKWQSRRGLEYRIPVSELKRFGFIVKEDKADQ